MPRQASRLAGHLSFLMDERKEPIQQQEHLSAHDQNSVQIHQPPAAGLKQPVTGEQNDQQQSENPGAGEQEPARRQLQHAARPPQSGSCQSPPEPPTPRTAERIPAHGTGTRA